jgi:L-iditol 2-dehydrogenase
MKTLSGYLRAPWQFELREVELPAMPPPAEILVRVEACGICGTDLATADQAKEWQAFGHEIAGVIEQVGPGVGHLQPGQKVVLETSTFCGHCELCRNGRVDLCNKAPNFWGRSAMGFSERLLAPACCAVPYEGLSPEIASLAEPAGVAYDMVKTAAPQLGERVALIGPGPIALMAIPLLLRSGARHVVCLGRSHSSRRMEIARRLGAEVVIADGPISERRELHRQFDHVLVTAPVDSIPPALALLAYGGELTYIGIGTGAGTISLDANDFHFRKLQLRASFASPALYFPVVLELLRAGIIPGEEIISHRFALPDLAQAMHLCRDDKKNVAKVIVSPGRSNQSPSG